MYISMLHKYNYKRSRNSAYYGNLFTKSFIYTWMYVCLKLHTGVISVQMNFSLDADIKTIMPMACDTGQDWCGRRNGKVFDVGVAKTWYQALTNRTLMVSLQCFQILPWQLHNKYIYRAKYSHQYKCFACKWDQFVCARCTPLTVAEFVRTNIYKAKVR